MIGKIERVPPREVFKHEALGELLFVSFLM